MAVLTLHRDSPLSDAERAALPPGCVVAVGMGDMVLKAELNMTTDSLLQFAFKLGQAVPGARLGVKGIPAGAPGYAPPSADGGEDGPVASAGQEMDPWKLAFAGSYAAALDRLVGHALDPVGRDRLRELVSSTDPERVAFACQAAALTGWKSLSPNLRRLLDHGDVRVRREAANALGLLAGPSVVPGLQRLLSDPSPEVREAAEQAIARIESR